MYSKEKRINLRVQSSYKIIVVYSISSQETIIKFTHKISYMISELHRKLFSAYFHLMYVVYRRIIVVQNGTKKCTTYLLSVVLASTVHLR